MPDLRTEAKRKNVVESVPWCGFSMSWRSHSPSGHRGNSFSRHSGRVGSAWRPFYIVLGDDSTVGFIHELRVDGFPGSCATDDFGCTLDNVLDTFVKNHEEREERACPSIPSIVRIFLWVRRSS